ncbi:MAG: Wzz/FepE/Etk N-terminal domain-containing protein [Thiogranum sp.]
MNKQEPEAGGAAQVDRNVRYIYLPLASSMLEEEISLLDYWRMIKSRKRFIVMFTSVIVAVVATLVLLMPAKYTAEVQMVHSQAEVVESSGSSDDRSTRDSSSSGGSSEEAIAILESRAFTEKFIRDQNLLPVLFAKRWDKERKQWKEDKDTKAPTMWDAFEMFNDSVREVETDQSGFTVLSIKWKDPELASQWANLLVSRINKHLKERDIEKAEKSLEFLRDEILQTNVADLEQALYGLIESQMQIIMIARVSDEYAFTVIDPAVPPQEENWPLPKRIALIVLATIAALMISSFIALVLGYFDGQKQVNARE